MKASTLPRKAARCAARSPSSTARCCAPTSAAPARAGPATFLLDRVAAELAERLAAVLRRFDVAVDLGTPTDALRRALAGTDKIGTLIAAEPSAGARDGGSCASRPTRRRCPSPTRSLDLVVSALALQWVNDLPGTLVQIRRALKPDGLFLAALLGGETLDRIAPGLRAGRKRDRRRRYRRASRRSPTCASSARCCSAPASRCRWPMSDRLTRALRVRLCADARPARAWARPTCWPSAAARRSGARRLMRMAEIYAERFADADGRVRATFEIVWLSGWAPHESQQKPLKPGSAPHAARRCAGHEGSAGRRKDRALERAMRVQNSAAELVVEIGLDDVAEPPDRRHDGERDAGGDQRVFDGGRAAVIAAQGAQPSGQSGSERRSSFTPLRCLRITAAPSGATSAARRPAASRSPATCSASPRPAPALPAA